MKERWKKDDRGGRTHLHSILPWKNWRCYVWLDEKRDCWTWEARRFGRGAIHVSGECEKFEHAKRIAVAAAAAVRGSWF